MTHIVFIKPDLMRDWAFFVPPYWDGSMPRITRISTIKKMMTPMKGSVPQVKATLSLKTTCMENPKVYLLTSSYKLSKESTFLMNNRRFGGGITPPDRHSTECAPHLLRGFFYRPLRPINLLQLPFLPPTNWNN